MKERNSNIEMLRIIAMLFVIMHHIVINGYGLQETLTESVSSLGGGIQLSYVASIQSS